MLQKVNTVFVAGKFNLTGATPAAADVIVYDASTGAVIDATTAIPTTVKAIQLGYVKPGDLSVTKTQVIGKTMITNITPDGTQANLDNHTAGAYIAPTNAHGTVNFTSATIIPGNRYVLRLIYRDLYEHPGQFTHSYEFVATTNDATLVATAITTAINAHSNARVVATISGDIITLQAKDITANGFGTQGLEAITPYSQVQMKIVAYTTVPASRYVSAYDAIPGLVITNVESAPGKGNPFIVRDREQAALAYKGITYRTEWPIIKPVLNTNLSATYDTLVIDFKNQYQSPDNQYVKSTELTAEVYVVVNATAPAVTLRDRIATWAGL